MDFPLSHEFICSTSLLYLVLFQIHFPIYPFTVNYLFHLFIIFYCIHSFLFPINCLLNFSIQMLKCSSFILGILVKKTRIWNTKNNKNVKFDEKERDGSNLCGINQSQAKNLKSWWKIGIWVKSVRNKSQLG